MMVRNRLGLGALVNAVYGTDTIFCSLGCTVIDGSWRCSPVSTMGTVSPEVVGFCACTLTVGAVTAAAVVTVTAAADVTLGKAYAYPSYTRRDVVQCIMYMNNATNKSKLKRSRTVCFL